MTNITLNGQVMRLKFTMNSVCELEERAGKGIMSLLNQEQMGFNLIRLLIWAGLKHNSPALTAEIVGDWLEAEFQKGYDLSNFIEMAMKALQESGLLGRDSDKKNMIVEV